MATKRVTFVLMILALASLATSAVAQEAPLPPLTDPGTYGVGVQTLTFADESRGDWELKTFVWFPVDKTQGTPFMGS